MILCKSCDAEIQPGQTFCVNCGVRTEGNTYSTGSPSGTSPAGSFAASTRTAPIPPAMDSAPPPYTPSSNYGPPIAPSLGTPPYQQTSYPSIPQSSTMAIVSLVFGLLGWTVLPLIGSIVAIITGHMGRREIRASGGNLTGDGMAIAGLILGYSAMILTLLACVVIAVLIAIGTSLEGVR